LYLVVDAPPAIDAGMTLDSIRLTFLVATSLSIRRLRRGVSRASAGLETEWYLQIKCAAIAFGAE
jgi:hypothetical protein